MRTGKLRQLGGSTVIAIPPAMLDQLGLSTGDKVEIALDGDRIAIKRRGRPKYLLADLLAKCDFSIPPNAEETAWMNDKPVGLEEI